MGSLGVSRTESSLFEDSDTQPHKDKSRSTSFAKDVIQRDTKDSRQWKYVRKIYGPYHMAPRSPMQKIVSIKYL
jgi:hypothetical protein